MSRLLQTGSWCLGFCAAAMLALAILAFPTQKAMAEDPPTAVACGIFCQETLPNEDYFDCVTQCVDAAGSENHCWRTFPDCNGWCYFPKCNYRRTNPYDPNSFAYCFCFNR